MGKEKVVKKDKKKAPLKTKDQKKAEKKDKKK